MASVGYLTLVRHNPRFRRLWYGQIVSQLGDWFDNIALYTIIQDLTGSGQALGLLLVAEFLPSTLVSPFAGVVLDRLPRKLVMVLSDLFRALLVLGFLLVQTANDIWLVYLLVVLKVVFMSFFEPARSALLPNIVSRNELVAANGLSGATWSAMLAFGAALGGLVTGTLGVQAAFLLDSATFLFSAWLIAGVPVVETHHTQPRSTTNTNQLSQTLNELAEGFRFTFSRLDIASYAMAKALWNVGGGVLVLLTLYGSQIFPLGEGGAISIGLFYAARGVGAGIGPLVALWLSGDSPTTMRRAVGLAYFLSVAGYLWFSATGSFIFALLAVVLAHMGGSINWVYSTALLQIEVPDRLRGRVFAVEYAALMLTTALSAYFTGVASDAGWAPRELSATLALMFLAPGLLLTALLWNPRPRREPPS